MLQKRVFEDRAQVCLRNSKAQGIDKVLVDVLNRLNFSQVYVISAIFTSLKVVLCCIPDRFCDRLSAVQAASTADNENFGRVLEEAKDLLNLLLARKVILSIIVETSDV